MKKIFSLILFFALFQISAKGIYAASYYVSTSGNDRNPGTISRPWKTLQKAFNTISGGDHVYVMGGVYRAHTFNFTPSGTDFLHKTVFEPYNNQFVLLTDVDGTPPQIGIDDYIVVKGFWIGGKRRYDDNGNLIYPPETGFHPGNGPNLPIGTGVEIINNTIFGYPNGINIGSSQDILISGNRFVRNGHNEPEPGSEDLGHGIYLSGGYTDNAKSQHVIVDNNIFIAGRGYGIHAWHDPKTMIITRNFVGDHFRGLVVGGHQIKVSDNPAVYKTVYVDNQVLVANNVIWKQKQQQAIWTPSINAKYINNIFGPDVEFINVDSNQADNFFSNNAYFENISPPGGRGANVYSYTRAEVPSIFGQSENRIDTAIKRLNSYFVDIPTLLNNKNNIEREFKIIEEIKTTPQSKLYRKGMKVFESDPQPNIGRNTTVDESFGFLNSLPFWIEFDRLGLKHYNRNYLSLSDLNDFGEKLHITIIPDVNQAKVNFYVTFDLPEYRAIPEEDLGIYERAFGIVIKDPQNNIKYIDLGRIDKKYGVSYNMVYSKNITITGLRPNTKYTGYLYARSLGINKFWYSRIQRVSFNTKGLPDSIQKCKPATSRFGRYVPQTNVTCKPTKLF